MKKNKLSKIFLIATVLALTIRCSKNKGINEYSKQLQINFPEDMTMVHYDTHSYFQDYSIQSTYRLSFNQKNALLEEIYFKTCDFLNKNEEDKLSSCWKSCEDYYSYEHYDEDTGLKINIVFVAQNDVRILSIDEVKF